MGRRTTREARGTIVEARSEPQCFAHQEAIRVDAVRSTSAVESMLRFLRSDGRGVPRDRVPAINFG